MAPHDSTPSYGRHFGTLAPRYDALAFAALANAGSPDSITFLMTHAVFLWVFVPLAAPAFTLHAVLCSAALWSAGFALYALAYWPVLTRPRIDGKPG